MKASLIVPPLLHCKWRYLWRRRSLGLARHMTAWPIASLSSRCERHAPVCLWRCRFLCLARHMAASLIVSLILRRKQRVLWRRRSLRLARHMTASLIAPLLSRCERRVPVAPSVPSLRSSHDRAALASLLLRRKRGVPVALSDPSLRSSHSDVVARCLASLTSHGGVAHCFASLKCLWRRQSLRPDRRVTTSLSASVLLRHMMTSRIASRLSRCKRHVPFAPSVLASLVTWRCLSLLRFSRVANDMHSAIGPFASLGT